MLVSSSSLVPHPRGALASKSNAPSSFNNTSRNAFDCKYSANSNNTGSPRVVSSSTIASNLAQSALKWLLDSQSQRSIKIGPVALGYSRGSVTSKNIIGSARTSSVPSAQITRTHASSSISTLSASSMRGYGAETSDSSSTVSPLSNAERIFSASSPKVRSANTATSASSSRVCASTLSSYRFRTASASSSRERWLSSSLDADAVARANLSSNARAHIVVVPAPPASQP